MKEKDKIWVPEPQGLWTGQSPLEEAVSVDNVLRLSLSKIILNTLVL